MNYLLHWVRIFDWLVFNVAHAIRVAQSGEGLAEIDLCRRDTREEESLTVAPECIGEKTSQI